MSAKIEASWQRRSSAAMRANRRVSKVGMASVARPTLRAATSPQSQSRPRSQLRGLGFRVKGISIGTWDFKDTGVCCKAHLECSDLCLSLRPVPGHG